MPLAPTTRNVTVDIPDWVVSGGESSSGDAQFKGCTIISIGETPNMTCKLLTAEAEDIDTITGASYEDDRGGLVISGTSRELRNAGVPIEDQEVVWMVTRPKPAS